MLDLTQSLATRLRYGPQADVSLLQRDGVDDPDPPRGPGAEGRPLSQLDQHRVE